MKRTRRLFNQITIVGVGLVGGSLAKAIRKYRLARSVYGVYRRKGTMRHAKAWRLPLKPILGLSPKVLGSSDAVILASPVRSIEATFKKIKPLLKPGTLVMDVGSTKRDILKASKELGKDVEFVGCHPIAGSEKQGAEHSDGRLFQDSICFITAKSSRSSSRKCAWFWKAMGSRVVYFSASKHDEVAAKVSHLPHIAATALVTTLSRPDARVLAFAGTGFKDTTRIAAAEPKLWMDILLSNHDNIAKELHRYIGELSRIRRALERKRVSPLRKHLTRAHQYRSAIA